MKNCNLDSTSFNPSMTRHSTSPASVRQDHQSISIKGAGRRREKTRGAKTLQCVETQRFLVPGAFKLDHFQPFKLILYQIFPTFLPFILGGPIPCHEYVQGVPESMVTIVRTGLTPQRPKCMELDPSEKGLFVNLAARQIIRFFFHCDTSSGILKELRRAAAFLIQLDRERDPSFLPTL